MIITCAKTELLKISDETLIQILQNFSTSKSGLTSSQATYRLQKVGPNEIPEKKKNPYIEFLKNFWGPIPWMIELAVIMSVIDQQWEDFWIIFSLLMLNAVILGRT